MGEKLNRFIGVLMVLLLAVVVIQNATREKDPGHYAYCVEWANYFGRDDLLGACYDFENQKWRCAWEIAEGSKLIIMNVSNQEQILQTWNCSAYAKAIKVD